MSEDKILKKSLKRFIESKRDTIDWTLKFALTVALLLTVVLATQCTAPESSRQAPTTVPQEKTALPNEHISPASPQQEVMTGGAKCQRPAQPGQGASLRRASMVFVTAKKQMWIAAGRAIRARTANNA